MVAPVSINPTATSGAESSARGGDISGGTAFNIGGINLGTQYPTAATAGGGVAGPDGFPDFGASVPTLLIVVGIAAVGILAFILWRK